MRTTLFRDGDYFVDHVCEQSYICWPGGDYPAGAHYGDPLCAALNVQGGWCVTGGEGLVVTVFSAGLPRRGDPAPAQSVAQTALWRSGDAKDLRFVVGLEIAGGDRVRATVDPQGNHAGVYEVDVRTLAWRRL